MNNLELLQAAVAARVAHWDAVSALEEALTSDDDDFSDPEADRMQGAIDSLAVGYGASPLTDEHLAYVLSAMAGGA